MKGLEQEQALFADITRLLGRYSDEFEMSNCQVLGVLDLVKMDVLIDANEPEEEDDDRN